MYRVKFYIMVFLGSKLDTLENTSRVFRNICDADEYLWKIKEVNVLTQDRYDMDFISGGSIEEYVDGIGWVVCE